MYTSRPRQALLLVVTLAVAACVTRIPFGFEESAAPIARATFLDASSAGAQIYQIEATESLVLIQVGRSGTMANLGHDHAVASTDLEGLIALHSNSQASFAEIAMPLKNLVVDNPVHRQQLGLVSEPSEKDIAGTYSNMQRVLEAETWPWVTVKATFADAESSPPLATVSISLHGVARSFNVPLVINVEDVHLRVEGHLLVTQSEFGITPFSALGGLLRVADELSIQFDLTATRRNP